MEFLRTTQRRIKRSAKYFRCSFLAGVLPPALNKRALFYTLIMVEILSP